MSKPEAPKAPKSPEKPNKQEVKETKKEEVVETKELTLDEIKKLNIYERMLLIESEIGVVGKNLTIGEGKNSYKAVGEADVKSSVSPLEVKYRVKSIPIGTEIVESGTVTSKRKSYQGGTYEVEELWLRIRSTVRFINIDKPDEFVDVSAYGDGIDSGDKACGKGDTYSVKYCYLKAYKIVTGDDPDKDASAETSVPKNTWKKQPTQSKPTTPPSAPSPTAPPVAPPSPSAPTAKTPPTPSAPAPKAPASNTKPATPPSPKTTPPAPNSSTPSSTGVMDAPCSDPQWKVITKYMKDGVVDEKLSRDVVTKKLASNLINAVRNMQEGDKFSIVDGEVATDLPF